MYKSIVLLLLSLSFCFALEKTRYDKYKVVRVQIDDVNQLHILKEIERKHDSYNFWESPKHVGTFTDLVIPPHKLDEFESFSTKFELKVETIINDLQSVIDNEIVGGREDELDWEAYYPLEAIYKWVSTMSQQHSKYVTTFEIGKTYEDRPILGLKISYKSGNPGIFIESNIHAREWITSATATWLINELLTSQDPAVRDLAENVDWYIIPVFNVDGFDYTHTTDRMWRKTRKPSSSLCFGTDLNRNFPYLWFTGGASNNPCSEMYAGPFALSEPEGRALLVYYDSIHKNVTAYISFHSYSQYLMYPYGSSQASPIKNEADHIAIGNAAVSALEKRYGTKYTMGNWLTTLYESSGVSMDWAKGKLDVPLAFTYEFRDKGKHGFLLPAEQIVPNSEEVLDSLVAFVEKARELGYFLRHEN